MSLTHALMFGPQAAFLPELFGTKVRYSGASLGCQVSAAISGGSPDDAPGNDLLPQGVAALVWAGYTAALALAAAVLTARRDI